MSEKLQVVASFEVPKDWKSWETAECTAAQGHKLAPIEGEIERVVEIRYSDEYGPIDAIYANGVRFVPEIE